MRAICSPGPCCGCRPCSTLPKMDPSGDSGRSWATADSWNTSDKDGKVRWPLGSAFTRPSLQLGERRLRRWAVRGLVMNAAVEISSGRSITPEPGDWSGSSTDIRCESVVDGAEDIGESVEIADPIRCCRVGGGSLPGWLSLPLPVLLDPLPAVALLLLPWCTRGASNLSRLDPSFAAPNSCQPARLRTAVTLGFVLTNLGFDSPAWT
jgi:hypothetical protein